jgi:CRISPR-associated protein Csm1
MKIVKDIKRETIYLAALLHDIGKFYQRGDGFWNSAKELSSESRSISGMASYTNDSGNPSHQHVYWTNEFLLRNKPLFQRLKIWEETEDSLINLAVYHHRPQSALQGIVTLADNWASGMDREAKVSDDDADVDNYVAKKDLNWGKYQFQKMPLNRIFNRILINEKPSALKESEQRVFPIAPLSLRREDIIGQVVEKDTPKLIGDYNRLWKTFDAELAHVHTIDLQNFIPTIHALLKKYTWSIPADTSTMYDNSLYEHLKMTASLALCIYDFQVENPTSFKIDSRNRWKFNDGVYPLRLWCIDLSGIQNFIYNISSKYAAKSLKGRSFYLQLLLDGVADYLLEETQMQLGNIVYSSGGKFFLLLPNTKFVNDKMEAAEKQLKDEIWEKFGLGIFLCFGSVAWAYTGSNYDVKIGSNYDVKIEGEHEPKNLGDLWKKVTQNASQQKQERYKEKLLDKELFDQLFSGKLDGGGETEICAITGEELAKPEKIPNTNDFVTAEVIQQIKIGERLKNFSYLIKGQTIKGERILHLTNPVRITQESSKDLNSSQISYVPPSTIIDFLSPTIAHKTNAQVFQFYGGSDVATYDEEPKTFEELAGIIRKDRDQDSKEIIDKAGNFNQLGVLRMDVDGLGKLFTHGFAKNNASFSALTTLSASLDWFFSGYLNTIRRSEDFKDWINIIYSGGDDIFAVGRWDKTIAFADVVQQEFKAFTQRPELSISGGLVIVTPKFPIGKSASMAGEAEDKAKDFKREVNGSEQEKDALCLFEIPVGWEEFESIKAWKNKLIGWLKEKYISKGLLMKLFSYYEVYRINMDDKSKTPDLSWKWNAVYQLARQANDTKNEAKKKALHELKNVIFTEIDKEHTFRFEAFIVACRWAELEHRDKLNN